MSGLGADFAGVLGRELDRLKGEIEAYEDEDNLWVTLGAQKNAPGTLALHLVGNLMHFVGASLGGSGYVRDRETEFGERAVPRAEIVRRLAECRDTVTSVLPSLSDEELAGAFVGPLPGPLAGSSNRGLLIHLTWHLGWHVGQVYYHRLAVEAPGD